MKKFFSLLMISLLVIAVISCGGKAKDNETADSDIETLPALLSADEAIPFSDIKLVRSDKSEQSETDAAVELRKAILALGIKVDLITDWTSSSGGYEIIVGSTNRCAATELRLDEYEIKREGKNIFIFAGSSKAMSDAAKYFIDTYMCESGVIIPDKYDFIKKSSVSVGTFTLSGSRPESASIYAGEFGGQYVDSLATLITQKVGIASEVQKYDSYSNILFVTEDEEIGEGEWGLVCRDGKLFIVGSDDFETRLAYKYLVSQLTNETVLEYDRLVYKEKYMTEEEFRKQKQLVIYPEYPEQINRIYDYDVSVTMDDKTEKIPVYNHVEESNVSRRSGADMYRRFSAFAFSGGQVRVDIRVKQDFTSYTVFPSAKNFKHDFKDGVISVYLDKPDYFGIQLDDDQNTILSVFADYPEYDLLIPSKGDPNVIYVEGWYEPEGGILKVDKEYSTLYIAPGAVLNARLYVVAPHCKVFGRGAIADPFGNLYEYDIRNGGTEASGIHLLEISKNAPECTIEYITLLDARTYNVTVGGKKTTIRNLKAMSTMMTTDGIGIGSTGSLVEHCWLYVGDNGLTTSGQGGITFCDITIGTTCAAIFPQCDAENHLYEDINVFRADDGVINNRYNGKDPIPREYSNIVFNRISAMEMPSGLTHFFQGGNMGTLSKTAYFKNISIPSLREVILYTNNNSYIYSDHYDLKFTNIAVDGENLTKPGQLTINNISNADNRESVEVDGDFKPVKRNVRIVNYTCPDKIYIGARQIFLSTDIKKQGGKIMFPTAEICALLRVKNVSDAEFVSTDELLSAKAIESTNDKGGTLYLVPKYTGKNLFEEDKGEISKYVEASCYQLDLVWSEDRDGSIYTVYSNEKSLSTSAGICRQITEEVKMYGTGQYKLTFSAKASEAGSLSMNYEADGSTKKNVFGVGTDWSSCSFTITVDDSAMKADKCVISVVGSGTVLSEFALRDFSFTKIN